MKTVSIAMRSNNDAPYAKRAIDSVLAQNFKDFEVLSFDDSSVDGTREIIDSYPQITRHVLPNLPYMPGRVLNFAVSKCDCKIVVFNNCDAIPLNPDWLERLIEPILSGRAQMAYARQLPRSDAQVWVRKDYSRAFPEKNALSADFFSAASSAFDMKIFDSLKFDESTRYSEDVMYSKRAREMGFKVEYAPNALVEHSHNYTWEGVRKRFAGEGAADARIFGKSPHAFPCAREIFRSIPSDFLWLAKNGGLLQFLDCLKFRILQKTSFYKAFNAELEKIEKEKK